MRERLCDLQFCVTPKSAKRWARFFEVIALPHIRVHDPFGMLTFLDACSITRTSIAAGRSEVRRHWRATSDERLNTAA